MRERKPMGRPREFDTDAALERIMSVFWTKGYDGASMADLVDATGLKKGSLYAAFGDKRAMYHQSLARYDRTHIDAAVCDLSDATRPRARIDAFLQSAIDERLGRGDPRGCFVCNASIDQAPVDPAAEKLVQASLDRLEAALAAAIAEDRDGSTSAVRRQARHLMSVYFGLRVLARAGAAPAVLNDAKRAAVQTLDRV